ncbi:hypothetical protein [Halorussus caseinilyticus]|uniref:DUF7979 domain-containing protein n=1 Tax=Halorussus caseinilyticus TaxID=3034025 RepID=A0ABD5WQ52_9EURY|nr:hypothetical protein [Halorussus sp. DT72]
MGKSLQFLMLFVGFCLVVGAFVAGIGAYEYEVKRVDTVTGQAPELHEFSRYEELDGRQKEIVDRAIAGEAVAVRRADQLPGKREKMGKLGVDKDDTYYVLTRRMFFNWRTTFGKASIGMGSVGFALTSEAVRRRQFPDRPVYWVRL